MAIAVALSLLAILYQASRPYIAVLGRIAGDPPVFADIERHTSAAAIDGFLILRPNVPLTFVNADVAKDQVMTHIAAQPERPRALILDIGATADFDVATMDMLAALSVELRRLAIDLRLSQVRGSVRDRMRRSGLMTTIGEDHCFLSDEAAAAVPLPDRPSPSGAETPS
jgi:MFS superfamily sulfate permease-like transporter